MPIVRAARAGLMPLLRVGRQVLHQPLMRLEAEPALHLVDDEAFECAEMPFFQRTVDEQRPVQPVRDDGCRRERTDQRTGHDDVDRAGRRSLRGTVRLRHPERVESDIGVALEAACGVPVGLSVAQKIEASWRNRHLGFTGAGFRRIMR